MISDETIERVREAADIVQIIGEHVNLKRSGADFRGPCPFHQGTHRNFSVSPRKGIYYCFVCHEGGDVFTFLQKRLGMEWPAAVRHVADRVGIEVRDVETRAQERDAREPFWELNAAAIISRCGASRVTWRTALGLALRRVIWTQCATGSTR
jgi:DNA primase